MTEPHDQSQVTILATKPEENKQLGVGDLLLILPFDKLCYSSGKNECLALSSALELNRGVFNR